MYLNLFTRYANDGYTVMNFEWAITEQLVHDDILADEIINIYFELDRPMMLIDELEYLGYHPSLIQSISRTLSYPVPVKL